jgi:release factor glutamine methyltransferase
LTLHETLARARARLVAADFSKVEASIDVDLYARTILGWDPARLLSDLQDAQPEGLEPTLSEWIARRARHEPTAYIVGVREFWGLDFAITPAVLVPRPETEFIVEEALLLLRSGDPRGSTPHDEPSRGDLGASHTRVADIGTGSGCVAVAVAVDAPGCRVTASDVSEAALAVARGNAARHGVADRVEFVATSYLDGVDGMFDVMTANPPYVKDGDKPALSRVTRHEPEVALFGGAEGLRDIAGVLDTAAAKLTPGGRLVMEFGYGQEESVAALVDARPALRLDHVRADLQDIPRTAIIQRR